MKDILRKALEVSFGLNKVFWILQE